MQFLLHVAEILALALTGLGLLIGIGKCLESADRRSSNELCYYGLATILFDCLAAMGAALGARFLAQPVSMAVIAVAYFLISAVLLLGVILSAIGLVKALIEHHAKQGRLAAALGLLIALPAGGGLGWLAWHTTRDGVPTAIVLYNVPGARDAAAVRTPAEPTPAAKANDIARAHSSTPPMDRKQADALLKEIQGWWRQASWLSYDSHYIYLRNYNARFRIPGSHWEREQSTGSRQEVLRYRHHELPIGFALYVATAPADYRVSTADATDLFRVMSGQILKDVYVLSDRSSPVQGLHGRRLDISFVGDGASRTQSMWAVMHNGLIYLMGVSGESARHSQVLSLATSLFSGFELLDDRDEAPAGLAAAAQDFEAPRFSYGVRLKGSKWREDKTSDEPFEGINFRAITANGLATTIITPLWLFGRKPHLDASAYALLSTFPTLPASLKSLEEREPITVAGLEGFECRGVHAKRIRRLRVLQGNGFAYLVLASAYENVSDADELLDEILKRIHFSKIGSAPPIETFTFRQQSIYAAMLTQIGTYYYKSRQYDAALPWYFQAMEIQSGYPAAMSGLIDAYAASGRYSDGCKLLEEHAEDLQSPGYRARYGWMLARLKRLDEAVTAYHEAFADRYRDDAVFADYLRLLKDMDQSARALHEADEYLEQFDSPAIIVEKAELLAALGREADAVKLLDDRQTVLTTSASLSCATVQAYCKAGESTKAMKMVERMMAEGHDSAQTWYAKSIVHVSRKQYDQAKKSLENALEKSPSDPDYKRSLEHLKNLLGQGENDLVREEVAPVKVPESLLDPKTATLPAETVKKASAWYRWKIRAIEFRADKEYRETTYSSIQLVDQTAVEVFSTIDIPFNSKSQQAYVNELTVYDEQGRKIGSGNLETYYVVDDSDGDVASFTKKLRIPVSGLRPGLRIDLATTVRNLAPYDGFPFRTHLFGYSMPIARSALYLHGDVSDVAWQGPKGVSAVKGNDEIYWLVQRPEIVYSEPLSDTSIWTSQKLYLNDRRSTWAKEVDDYLDVIEDRLKLPEATRKQAMQIVAGLKTDEAKLAALVDYVQQNVTYKAIEFGRRARVMNSSDQTLNHRYGDCKDHSLLLVHLCEAVGIPARLALIDFWRDVATDLPSAYQFGHAIVYLPDANGGRFVDCTDKYDDLSMPVPLMLGGKLALVLERGHGRLVRVADCPAGVNRLEIDRAVRCTPEGELFATDRMTCHGYWAWRMRGKFKHLSSSGRKSALAAMAGGAGHVEVLELRMENADRTDAPFVLIAKYRLDQVLHSDGGRLLGALPLLWEQQLLEVEYLAKRRTPFRLESPTEFKVQTVLDLPRGYVLAPLDSSDAASAGDFFRWKMHIATTPDGATINSHCSREAGRFKAERYADFYREAQAARKALTPKLIIRRSGS